MPPQGSDTQSLHDELVPGFLALLATAPPLEDAAALELLAGTVLMALGQPELPAGLDCAVLDAVLARRDEEAAGLLAALAVLAAGPLAVQAQDGVRQLAADGVISPIAAGVGRLALVDAALIEGEDAELLVALLARPGTQERQAAILGIEHGDTGGALVECELTVPLAVSEAHELLDGLDGADPPAPIGAEELTARVLAGARRTAELEIALGPAAAAAWPIVSRALTGDPAGLPRPHVDAAWEGDDDPELLVDAAEDEDGFQRVMERLLGELEQHARATHGPGSAAWEHGDFVASTMLQWKGGYDDGRLGHWTRAALAEYLLDYFPRKVSADEDTLAAVPECVCSFLAFLDARGSLSGDPLEELEEACGELVDEFRERARDRSNWGLAKSMFMRMHAEGVDTDAAGAIDAWMADLNARPREQRDAVIGPAADRMARAAGFSTSGPGAGEQKARRRKATRQARRRNRRG